MIGGTSLGAFLEPGQSMLGRNLDYIGAVAAMYLCNVCAFPPMQDCPVYQKKPALPTGGGVFASSCGPSSGLWLEYLYA